MINESLSPTPNAEHLVGFAVDDGSKGERACFARAAARVIDDLTAWQIETCGAELLKLIVRNVPVDGVDAIRDRARPTSAEMRAIARQLARKRKVSTALDKMVGWIGEIFEMDADECHLLGVFARWSMFEHWRDLVGRLPRGGHFMTASEAAKLAGLPIRIGETLMVPGARLLATGLLRDDRDGEYRLGGFLKRLLRTTISSRSALEQKLLPGSEIGSLDWEDFEHLGALRRVAQQVVSAAEPVSILLYGDPGTGKTEFARALARQSGCAAHFCGMVGDDGNEPDRSERLTHLMFMRAICQRQSGKLLVVDEADDVLVMTERNGASKQWLNRLVEAPQVSTVWIVNQRDNLDPALLRRMTLAIGFDCPRLPVRERIVQRASSAANVVLTAAEVRDIAGLKTSAAVVAAGMKVARLTQGGGDVARTAIHSVMRALGQSRAPERAGASVYDPALSRADTDLGALAGRLIPAPEKGWSLLLTGPSGTGKSAFARHLAAQMGMELEERRCSDLLSPFVGETEQKIAQAFDAAAERGAVLLIDEADSFLYRREGAQRSWEASRVNEMLVQMEHLRCPFIATTNLAEALDPATQRRFTLRVAFQAMTHAQASQLFEAYFGQAWPADLAVHDDQTPGDFAVVAQRAHLLGQSAPEDMVRWLREEIAARGGNTGRPMGFRLASLDGVSGQLREKVQASEQ
jgi:SpoVK/Ycf46/Vps4 family AAA+-type ATPase